MVKINLLTEVKEAYRKKGGAGGGGVGGEGLINLNTVLIAAMVVLGLSYFGFMYFKVTGETKDLKTKIARAEQEKARLQKVLDEVDRFERKKASLQRKIELIQSLKRGQKGPVRIMDELSRELPDLLWIDNLDLISNALSIRGRALNLNSIGTFIDNLDSNQFFSEPALRDIALTSGPSYTFSMSLNYLAPVPKNPDEDAAPPAG